MRREESPENLGSVLLSWADLVGFLSGLLLQLADKPELDLLVVNEMGLCSGHPGRLALISSGGLANLFAVL